jgi:hypothetical protein
VSPEVGRVAPRKVARVPVNGSFGMLLHGPDKAERATLTKLEGDRLARVEEFMREEFGYIAIQSTRPQTLAAALVDSPVGQLAWILDKFREWTYPRATLPDAILDRDRLLTNVMIYWLTGTAGSSAYVGTRRIPAGERRSSSRVCRPARSCSRTMSASAVTPRTRRTSPDGSMCRVAVAISPPWRSRRCSSTTFGSSSATCGEQGGGR